MNLKIFMAVFLSAVSMTTVVHVAASTKSTSTSSATVKSSTATSTMSTTSTSSQPSTSTIPTPSTTTPTTQTTTPKPIVCSEGRCDEGEDCFSASEFGTNTTCQSGESCAVNETKINSTHNIYIVYCTSAADCQTIQTAGIGACCQTDYCKPNLKAAKTKAKSKGNKKNGCDFPQLDKIVVICMTIMLYMTL
ncbi:uncharacterized protein LOC123562091 [Mercenaria mercenaria]|uniref:uncharacterized protein LOC123562091 n=1 Tax=Mercenaria mercenaria TaxID=6596 RepID=UPI00234E5F3D|nr:uncharacterized protein LOC123562091 [Mercenaria mercenaria]